MKDANFYPSERKLISTLSLITDRRTLPLIIKSRLRKISDSFLKEAYMELVKDLLKDERNRQMMVTDWEKAFRAIIKEYSRLEFISSCWIGNMNFDLFFPALRFGEYQGLAIEINGSYHDTCVQMKKDEYRANSLNEMGIYLISIQNSDIENGSVVKVVEEIIDWERLESKSKKRLLRKIYLKTILDHRKRVRDKKLKLASIVLDAFGTKVLSSLGEAV